MAHSYTDHGFWALHGIPIQNEGTDGVYPDFYSHWPPLYAFILSFFLRYFGDKQAVVWLFAVMTSLAFAGSFFHLVRAQIGAPRAVAATFSLLSTPVFLERAHVWTVSLCFAVMLLNLHFALAFGDGKEPRRRFSVLAIVTTIIGVLISWEAVLFAPGLFLAALALRNKRLARFSVLLTLISILTCVAFLGLAVGASPELRGDLISTVKYRVGGAYSSAISVNSFGDRAIYATQPGLHGLLLAYLSRLLHGALYAPFLFLLFFRLRQNRYRAGEEAADRRLLALVVVFSFVAFSWFAMFSNHVYIHDYQALLLVPLSALGGGEAFVALWHYAHPGTLRARTRLAGYVLPGLFLCISVITIWREYKREITSDEQPATIAVEMGELTPANAAIGSPELSMIFPYYSRRHIVRGVQNDWAVAQLVQHRKEYPDSPFFLAIPLNALNQFSCTLATYPKAYQDSSVVLIQLDRPSRPPSVAGCTGY